MAETTIREDTPSAGPRAALGVERGTVIRGVAILAFLAICLFVLPTFYTLLATDHREVKREKRNAEIAAVS